MMTRPKQLLLLAFLLLSTVVYWGCEQPATILADKDQTVLYLEPERMPSTPYGMIYNLAVADAVVDDSVQGVVNIAEFGYDWDGRKFLNADGTVKADSNRFVFQGDIYNYGYILVTLQRTDGSDGGAVGPVMLIDEIQDPFDDPLLMVFPQMDTVTASQAFFNMKAVSDDSSWNDTSTATNGAGLWFNSVSHLRDSLQDTVELISFEIDTVWREDLGDKDCLESIVDISNYDSVIVPRGFGLDTIMQKAIRYDAVTYLACVDSTDPPYLTTTVKFDWRVGATGSDGVWREDSFLVVPHDNHVQIGGYWKDLTGYGWKYEGWVVSSAIEAANASVGDMTRPAWVAYNISNDSLIRGITGGLLSTGTFVSLEEPDDANPYIASDHIVPPFPGEDFLNVPGASGPVQLVPGGGSTGTIFIAMHPSNAATDSTNFPLLVGTIALPASRAQVLASRQGYNPDQDNGYSYSLIGRAVTDLPSSPAGPLLQGFPQIEVKFDRQ